MLARPQPGGTCKPHRADVVDAGVSVGGADAVWVVGPAGLEGAAE